MFSLAVPTKVTPWGVGFRISWNESVRRETPRPPVHSQDCHCGRPPVRASRRNCRRCTADAPHAQLDRILAPLQVRAHRGRIRADAFDGAAYFQRRGTEHPAPVTQAGLFLEVNLVHQRHYRHHDSRRAELAVYRQVRTAVHESSRKQMSAAASQRPCHDASPRNPAFVCHLPRARVVQVASCACCGLQIAPAKNSGNRAFVATIERRLAAALFLADTAMVTNLAAG